MIKEFKKIGKLLEKMPKHEPTDTYFHLARELAKRMMRSDQIDRKDHGSCTGKTYLSSNVNVTDKDKTKETIVHKTFIGE